VAQPPRCAPLCSAPACDQHVAIETAFGPRSSAWSKKDAR
jgi:hypothetical protein